MNKKLIATADIYIDAAPATVWEALTDVNQIKRYFFGVDVITDWKVGGPILYKGEWEGKQFIDKGNIIKVSPPEILLLNYWSSFSGLPDLPGNYQNILYELIPETDGTHLIITQDNITSEEEQHRCIQNWMVVLNKLKKILENK